ncbi:uncharacterized protein EV154DRAFT_507491 [Mucor mucedo]|uniref:uncharacterized protein n=1 Tax=Mucor mucedo TaxID=29922 RepID=UPI00221FF259|nr:uncharacterized protein EV154DRAFT_507491 [Mucor mucedo]KAI7891677.1 hypothetical protein EV154DRAFT_507491 [Mucor mucedo]
MHNFPIFLILVIVLTLFGTDARVTFDSQKRSPQPYDAQGLVNGLLGGGKSSGKPYSPLSDPSELNGDTTKGDS